MDEPRTRWGAATAILVAAVAAGWTTGSVAAALVAAVCLGLALWRIFVPARYEIDAVGVAEKTFRRQRRVPWRAVGCWDISRDGVHLHPQSDPAPIDRFRTLYVPWGPERERVLGLLRYHAGAPRDATGSTITFVYRGAAEAEPPPLSVSSAAGDSDPGSTGPGSSGS